jgi:uncharacterized protein (TIGR02145 family)
LEKIPTGTNVFPGITAGVDDDDNESLTGAIVYSTNAVNPGIYVWTGHKWVSICDHEPAIPVVVPAVSISAVPGNTIIEGENVTFTATPTNGGSAPAYQWKLNGGNIPSATGSTYATTSLADGNVITCEMTSNDPDASPATVTSNTITMTVTALADIPTVTDAVATLTGRKCFDISETDKRDDSSDRPYKDGRTWKAQFAPVANTDPDYNFRVDRNGNNVYTFKTGSSGSGKNLRFVYMDSQGVVVDTVSAGATAGTFGSNYTATLALHFRQDLNTRTGNLDTDTVIRTRSRTDAVHVEVYALWEKNDGTPQQKSLTLNIQDDACCGAYLDISHTQWLPFMCHNLGADPSLDPFGLPVTRELHGDWYKFGAKNPTLTNTVENDSYSAPGSGFGQWSNPVEKPWQSSGDWSSSNNPCPPGWQLPSQTDWLALYSPNLQSQDAWVTGSWDNKFKFGTYLTLPVAGYRHGAAGVHDGLGYIMHYWTRSGWPTGEYGYVIYRRAGNATMVTERAPVTTALSCRCVSE